MKICDKCKFAEWDTTANGRLHPKRGGRCKKEVKIVLPQAFYTTGGGINVYGGFIERGRELKDHCVYWQEAANG